ncbi:zinc finger and BTB domain-containing protein 25 [Gastrophryne carolinensis]
MELHGHSLMLLQQLNMQREFGFLCDCTVAIGDVYFKAHRAVLAAFSNYFKMIFIHQSSECIKIQPADIQPDIFSYLLHVMYTGRSPKQSVDHFRLEEGVRFLHANFLLTAANEQSPMVGAEAVPSSNLYGIQISTAQKAQKESLNLRNNPAGGSRAPPQGEQPQLQLSLAIGLEGVSPEQQGSSHFPVKSIEDMQSGKSIKQESCDPESGKSPPREPLLPKEEEEGGEGKVFSCHYCGEPFSTRDTLRDHLHIHVSQSLPFGVPTSILESNDLGEVRPLLENMESAGACRLQDQEQDSDPIELNFSFLRKRKFPCGVCGRRFQRRSALHQHLYTHKGQKGGGNLHRLHNYCTNHARPGSPQYLEDMEPTSSHSEDSLLVE